MNEEDLKKINDERIWCDALYEDLRKAVTESDDIPDE